MSLNDKISSHAVFNYYLLLERVHSRPYKQLILSGIVSRILPHPPVERGYEVAWLYDWYDWRVPMQTCNNQ